MFWYFYYSALYLFLWMFRARDSVTGAVTALGPSGPLKFRVPRQAQRYFSSLIMLILCFDISITLSNVSVSVIVLGTWLCDRCRDSIGPDGGNGPDNIHGPVNYIGPINSVGPENLHGPMSGPLWHWVPFMGPVVFLVIINSLMCILRYTTIVKIKNETIKK